MAKKDQLVADDISEATEDSAAVTETAPEDLAANETLSEEVPAEDQAVEDDSDTADDELTEEEMRIFEELQRKVSRKNRSITKATRQEKKQMYSSDHVVTETGELEVKTESTKLKEDLMELNASYQAKRILEGTIIGYRSANPDSDIATNLAEVEFGNGTCTVLIPDFVLFQFDITKYRTKEYQQGIAKRVREMIGARVKFVVKTLDQPNRTAYADRLKAMETEAYANYLRDTREGKPRVIPEMLVQARVVAVRKDALIVYALGSESIIRKNEISWFYISDLREEYKVNDMVIVKVLEVKSAEVEKYQHEKYRLVATKLSIKQTTPDPMLKWFDFFKVGGAYQATITGVTESGSGVFVTLQNRVVCMCGYPKFGNLPVLGEQRVVEVTEKKDDENGKRIYGVFVRT